MSPYSLERYRLVVDEDIVYARLFYVYGSSNPGRLDNNRAGSEYGVRPVISLEYW